ncbi:MAG: hypothetical protein DRH32_06025 [Deltaproteobacteria bacterium]|nr:MAG: hypothetical protein DRH32_06025 [Deltaproteobacteria bacterium]
MHNALAGNDRPFSPGARPGTLSAGPGQRPAGRGLAGKYFYHWILAEFMFIFMENALTAASKNPVRRQTDLSECI